MRDIFEDIFANPPLDPVEAARKTLRPKSRQRFYDRAETAPTGGGFGILLDGRPVRTPARRLLAAPSEPLAQAIAAEWNGQVASIDPARMPLTRLANSIIDGVGDQATATAAEIVRYLGSDLVFYRADTPDGLVARQQAQWDPVLAWARGGLAASFVTTVGVTHVRQPEEAVSAAARAIPKSPWQLGAVHSVTTLTGSALLALALAAGAVDLGGTWAAAHVDEDWNIELWGRDDLAQQARDFRFAELQAAATVLALTR